MAKTWAIFLMFICTFFTSIAQLFYKFGAEKLSFNILSIITNYYIIIGIILYFIGFVLMIKAFKGGEVTILYPIVSTSYIWVGLLSMFFLKETLAFFKWIGVISIIFGIIFINLGKEKAIEYTEVI